MRRQASFQRGDRRGPGIERVSEVPCPRSFSIAPIRGRGAAREPIRQLVIAPASEQPFIVTVRSRRRGSASTKVAKRRGWAWGGVPLFDVADPAGRIVHRALASAEASTGIWLATPGENRTAPAAPCLACVPGALRRVLDADLPSRAAAITTPFTSSCGR